MNDDQPIDIDQVGSDDISMASGASSGKKRARAPAKYVWQYFKRYKDPLGKEVKRNNRYHQVCLGCQTCLKSCEVVTAEDHLLKCTPVASGKLPSGSNCQFVSLCSAR